MDWKTVAFDWNHARAFLAIAETGSLSAAARALKQTQPTLGRQLAALESELGVVLFERVGRGLVTTPTGVSLAHHVRAMRDAAANLSLAASGRSDSIEGTVAISASDIYSAHLLPPILLELGRIAPKLQINIIATNTLSDLLRREADIAIRHVRPSEPDLIARHISQGSARLVGAQSYFARKGRPTDIADLSNHDFVCFGDVDANIGHYREYGIDLTPENFKMVSESGIVAWEMVRAGAGLTFMDNRVIATSTTTLRDALPNVPAIEYPIWLTTHREIHKSQKIRLVFDLLARTIPAALAAPRG